MIPTEDREKMVNSWLNDIMEAKNAIWDQRSKEHLEDFIKEKSITACYIQVTTSVLKFSYGIAACG